MSEFVRAWRERLGLIMGTRQGAWLVRTFIQPLDHLLARASGGRLVFSNIFYPTLLLTTTGAKSGQPRTVPLLYLRDGQRLVVIASNFGRAGHPAWYLNLRANPACRVALGARSHDCRAREADGAEREELWRRAVLMYAGYSAYATRAAGRRIPVIVLEPT